MPNPLYKVPGLGGFLARRQMIEQEGDADLQRTSAEMGIMAALAKQRQEQQFREALAATGGDPEKAIAILIKGGNVGGASQLAPLAKLAQERREREETRKGLSAILAPQEPAPVPVNPMAPGPQASVMAGSGTITPPVPASTEIASQKRLEALKKMSVLYAGNPSVMAALQREIDKLEAEKPMIENNFPIGEDRVQPHISYDRGRTWQPLPGSKPGAKFAKQVGPTVVNPPSVTATLIVDPKDPSKVLNVDARTYRGGSIGSPGVIGYGIRESDAQKREAKRQFNMQGIGATIQSAENILNGKDGEPLPTGSGFGTAVDYAASLIGVSPSGSGQADQLRALGGALTAKMPRMEGPQSDKDVALYKEMAARVGDSTLPIPRRKAALETVKELWVKYERLNPDAFAGGGAPAQAPSAGGWSIRPLP